MRMDRSTRANGPTTSSMGPWPQDASGPRAPAKPDANQLVRSRMFLFGGIYISRAYGIYLLYDYIYIYHMCIYIYM